MDLGTSKSEECASSDSIICISYDGDGLEDFVHPSNRYERRHVSKFHRIDMDPMCESHEYQGSVFQLNCLAAGIASAVASGLYNPLDSLRIRWQIQASPKRGGVQKLVAVNAKADLWCFTRNIMREEGLWSGLWRPGLVANMAGMSVASALRFGFYETVGKALSNEGKRHGFHMFLSGLVCGSMAYFITTPFHLIKTKLQADAGNLDAQGMLKDGPRRGHKPFAKDYISAIARIVQEGGVRSLWKGALPLSIRGALFTAGQFVGYDGMKTLAKNNGHRDDVSLHLVAGISAALCASTLATPADLVMTRFMSHQTSGRSYHILTDSIWLVYKEEGVAGYWKGWPLFFIRLVPVMLTYSTVYEQLRCQFGLGYL